MRPASIGGSGGVASLLTYLSRFQLVSSPRIFSDRAAVYISKLIWAAVVVACHNVAVFVTSALCIMACGLPPVPPFLKRQIKRDAASFGVSLLRVIRGSVFFGYCHIDPFIIFMGSYYIPACQMSKFACVEPTWRVISWLRCACSKREPLGVQCVLHTLVCLSECESSATGVRILAGSSEIVRFSPSAKVS
jgi:hypothetical protein